MFRKHFPTLSSQGYFLIFFCNSFICSIIQGTFFVGHHFWSPWRLQSSLERLSRNKKNVGEQDGGRIGGHGVHLSPWIHQKYTLRPRSACRTPAESWQEYLTSGKEYMEHRKTREEKRTSGKNRSVCRTRTELSGGENWRRGPIPTSGQLSETEEKHLRLGVKQLICVAA